jgi:hypothetical protein
VSIWNGKVLVEEVANVKAQHDYYQTMNRIMGNSRSGITIFEPPIKSWRFDLLLN